MAEHDRAVKLLDKCRPPTSHQLAKAEAALHRALAADVTHGPAHNTLGKVYYLQDRFYVAAWEFEYATKVMPGRSEPVNNLGMVYEAVGKFDQALEAYEAAFTMDPQNPEVLGNLARCHLRRGDPADEIGRQDCVVVEASRVLFQNAGQRT